MFLYNLYVIFTTTLDRYTANVLKKSCKQNATFAVLFCGNKMILLGLSRLGYRGGFWAYWGQLGLDKMFSAFCQLLLDKFVKFMV